MLQKLTPLQIKELLPFRFAEEKRQSQLSVEMIEWQSDHYCQTYLEKVRCHIGAANERTAASMFIKRYAFLPVIFLYAMSIWNGRLDISFSNVSLETEDTDELWLPGFFFKDTKIAMFQQDRELWREECIKNLFAHHVNPLINQLSNVSKISKLILWENIAVYIIWLYENLFTRESMTEEMLKRCENDFSYLLFQAKGSLFGAYSENPLKRFYNQPIYLEDIQAEVRPRSTCCYSYLTESKKRCISCPHSMAACPLIQEISSQEEQLIGCRMDR